MANAQAMKLQKEKERYVNKTMGLPTQVTAIVLYLNH